MKTDKFEEHESPKPSVSESGAVPKHKISESTKKMLEEASKSGSGLAQCMAQLEPDASFKYPASTCIAVDAHRAGKGSQQR